MRRAACVAFAFIIMASALAVLTPAAVAAADPPALRADPMRVELVAGGQFRGFLTISSRSDFGDAFDVAGTAGSPSAAGIHVSMDRSNVPLAPGAVERVGFLIQVPRTHASGDHLLRFDASGTNLSSSAYLFVRVLPYEDGGLDGGQLPATDASDIGAGITDGGVFERDVRVTNQNVTNAKRFDVRLRPIEGWAMSASPASLDLGIGESATVRVRAEPTAAARNGSTMLEIGSTWVHTAVQVSLNVTHDNVSTPVLTPIVEVTTDPGVLPIAFDTSRNVRFYLRDVTGAGWSGEVDVTASSGFLAEGSRDVIIPPGGTTTLVLMVSSQSAIPGDTASITATVGSSSATKDVRIEGSFVIEGDVQNLRLGEGESASVEITIRNTGIYSWTGSLDFAHPLGVQVLGDPAFRIDAGTAETRTFTILASTGLETGEVHFIIHDGRMWRIRLNDAGDARQLRITGDRSEIAVGAKDRVPVNITVHNDAAEFWTGGMAVTASPFLVVYGNETFTLPPGGSGTRQFNVTLAAGATPSEGRITFGVAGAEWVVDVRPPPDQDPDPDPDASPLEVTLDRDTLVLEAGQRGMVRVRVVNRGNETWSGDLARDASLGLALAGDTGTLVLAPGAEQTVDVFVTLEDASAGSVLFDAGGARALLRIEQPVGTAGPVPIAPEAPALDPRVGVALGAGGIAVAAGAAAAAPKRWPLAFAGLYARLAGSRLLEHPVRRRIRELVDMAPGISYNEIGRQLELERGVLDHHLRKLESSGLVSSVQDGQYRRFYAPGSAHPVVRGALDARILRIVRERGETRASEVAATLGVSRQAMHYHLRRMVREGSIVANRGAGGLILRASA